MNSQKSARLHEKGRHNNYTSNLSSFEQIMLQNGCLISVEKMEVPFDREYSRKRFPESNSNVAVICLLFVNNKTFPRPRNIVSHRNLYLRWKTWCPSLCSQDFFCVGTSRPYTAQAEVAWSRGSSSQKLAIKCLKYATRKSASSERVNVNDKNASLVCKTIVNIYM